MAEKHWLTTLQGPVTAWGGLQRALRPAQLDRRAGEGDRQRHDQTPAGDTVRRKGFPQALSGRVDARDLIGRQQPAPDAHVVEGVPAGCITLVRVGRIRAEEVAV
jgi:hypothetical protein